MNTKIIAIDPGASGGIAWRDGDGITRAIKMPPRPRQMVEEFRRILFESGLNNSVFVVEAVGSSRPGNSARASTTFARHCGLIDGIIAALDGGQNTAPPKTWMKGIGIPAGMEKAARKNEIKRLMQEAHPHIKVTLALSDALGILTWAENPF